MEKIKKALRSIEHERNVEILYACEAGSRAFGYESEHSDYDVRFIYTHPREWYLSLFDKRDVIESTIGDIELHGWDIKKTLWLLSKSNPTLLEWLHSQIIYKESAKFLPVRTLATELIKVKPILFHYVKLGKGNCKSFRKTANQKHLLYALKSLLLVQWISVEETMPEMNLTALLETTNIPEEIKMYSYDLLNRKPIRNPEPVLSYIETVLKGYENKAKGLLDKNEIDKEKIDRIYRKLIED
ncbi:nucleotidyltransferase domain-containing protein [Guptibacillus algicola]|uniref:nucleotidyltransferase domain-containing protein n=1 Tax=Guptibacillus algicola TaxID=225844 RepID=UPI001CD51914|nr:nucleotidyltransferase domain-containing protein [Alkalihalobacillus algicola]MCA0988411.1 nucleotidyltransferase domain-containing protein [Alkalihalobacillus algicola]